MGEHAAPAWGDYDLSLPVNDTFTRADETPLGGNYTHITGGSVLLNIATNALITSTAVNGECGYYWNADTFANDQWASLDATTAHATNSWAIGVNLRADTAGGGSVRTHYYANANGPGALGSSITRRLAGVKSVLTSEPTTNWGSAPFTVYAEISAQVINLKQGGAGGTTVLTFNDTGGITSGNPGPFMFPVSNHGDIIGDNFQADNLVVAVTSPSLPMGAYQAVKRGAFF